MSRSSHFRAVLSLLIAAGAVVMPVGSASAAPVDVEVRVLQLINQGRSGVGKSAEVMHAGLRSAARDHSAYQASIRRMTHDGLAGRVGGASPDPYESNGAPDDGFGTYCENVAYYYPGSAVAPAVEGGAEIFAHLVDCLPLPPCMFHSC